MDRAKDADLVLRCLAGDTECYGELVRRYQAPVYATAFYYTGRYGDVEEVTQEAFWAAYRSLPLLKEPERFGTWLKGITTRTAANWLRRNAPRLRYETPLPHRRQVPIEDVKPGPARSAEKGERFDRVQRAIDSLPERYRLPVVLHFLQELSYDEISSFTGETRDEIRGILHRASKQLRDQLADIQSSEEDNQWHLADK